jgi:hypothetical protein
MRDHGSANRDVVVDQFTQMNLSGLHYRKVIGCS